MQNLFRSLSEKLNFRTPTPYPLISNSGKIALQPLKDDELILVEEWFQDRETCELAFGVRAPWNILTAIRAEYMEELQRDKVGVLSVKLTQQIDHSNSGLVGFVRYKLYHRVRKKSARVGIILGPPDNRGKGVGREAFQTLVDYLFSARQVHTIELDTALFNEKARRCFEACGFSAVREAEFPSMHGQGKETRLMMKLEREDWATFRRSHST